MWKRNGGTGREGRSHGLTFIPPTFPLSTANAMRTTSPSLRPARQFLPTERKIKVSKRTPRSKNFVSYHLYSKQRLVHFQEGNAGGRCQVGGCAAWLRSWQRSCHQVLAGCRGQQSTRENCRCVGCHEIEAGWTEEQEAKTSGMISCKGELWRLSCESFDCHSKASTWGLAAVSG
jgi:hypothetical protein